ncbi:unnamed protein product [Ranitomeya imitator]|uniref:Integrin alpha first immunoglubulin-like domain-containing protein n=1 Tax=Ranitomeya imitator TaxID=111125 RepID=A0ABN9L2V1_9NEOB|nr:unnamed protein product [Ranitomeya imitator]
MNGAIYIYNGREKGITPSFTQEALLPTDFLLARGNHNIYYGGTDCNLHVMVFLQRIRGQKFGYSLSTFGQSISTGLDADGNGYQDLAVGAFLSDSAVLLRTIPVIALDASLKLPSSVNRTRYECVEQGHPAVCMNVTICFRYQGKGVPGHIVLHYNISSDIKRKKGTPARFYFSSNGTAEVYSGRIDLGQKSESCRTHQAFMRSQEYIAVSRDNDVAVSQDRYVIISQDRNAWTGHRSIGRSGKGAGRKT